MKELFKAIADFQQEVPILHKSGNVSFNNTKYSFISIDKIVKQINPIMKKHKLGFVQPLEGSGIKTIVFHTETGDSIESFVEIPDDRIQGQNPFQSRGSAITYFRRYALSSMLGLITDADLDACGEQETSNGIEDPRIDKYANGKDLEDQIKKCIVAISRVTESNAPAKYEDFDNLPETELREILESYKTQEVDFNSKKWIDDQLTKPRKSGSVESLRALWKEAEARGFLTPYVELAIKNKKESLENGQS